MNVHVDAAVDVGNEAKDLVDKVSRCMDVFEGWSANRMNQKTGSDLVDVIEVVENLEENEATTTTILTDDNDQVDTESDQDVLFEAHLMVCYSNTRNKMVANCNEGTTWYHRTCDR
jgi:hypothetical protein